MRRAVRFAASFCLLGACLSACAANSQTSNLKEAEAAIADFAYDAAVRCTDQALLNGENARQAHRLAGIAYLKSARYDEAVDALTTALAMSDGVVNDMDYDMNLYLASAHLGKGDVDAAIAVYGNILDLRPADVDTLFARGVAYLSGDRLTAATADFDRAIATTPRDFDLRLRVYQAYAQAGHEETGRAILSEAMNAYDAALTNYEKGRFAFYMGNNGEAQSYLEKALSSARGEERAQVVLLLGQTGEKQGDLNYAMSVYSQLLDSGTPSAAVYNRRGLCLMEQGDYNAAIADFEAGVALGDDESRQALLRNEIVAYERLGNFDSARRLMSDYIQRYPDDADAAREWLFLQTR